MPNNSIDLPKLTLATENFSVRHNDSEKTAQLVAVGKREYYNRVVSHIAQIDPSKAERSLVNKHHLAISISTITAVSLATIGFVVMFGYGIDMIEPGVAETSSLATGLFVGGMLGWIMVGPLALTGLGFMAGGLHYANKEKKKFIEESDLVEFKNEYDQQTDNGDSEDTRILTFIYQKLNYSDDVPSQELIQKVFYAQNYSSDPEIAKKQMLIWAAIIVRDWNKNEMGVTMTTYLNNETHLIKTVRTVSSGQAVDSKIEYKWKSEFRENETKETCPQYRY